MSTQRSRNKSSVLLSVEENESIFNQLENGETSLSTTVIQLVLSEPPDHSQWKLFSTGVVCFVKQNRKRTYSFRLYDFDSKEKIWEQEIYLNIDYISVETMFHTFEAEDCAAGLIFADQTEADEFLLIVSQKIIFLRKLFGYNKKAKNEINRNQMKTEMTSLEVPEMSPMRTRSLESVVTNSKFSFRFKSSKKSKLKEKSKLDKLEIGMPTNFKHLQHIGWSPTTGFDFNVIDPKLHNFFSSAGISEHQLNDKDTRKFIFDFIDRHGGLEAAIKESDKSNQIKRSATISTGSEVKPNITNKPEINRQSEFMPPPPPPPPPNLDNYRESFLPPPPPPPPIVIQQISDSTEDHSPKNNSNDRNSGEQNGSNDRNELLEQIRGGIRLKKTESTKSKTNTLNIESSGNTLANALSKALQNRFRVNQIEDNSSEDSDDNYDERERTEWSD